MSTHLTEADETRIIERYTAGETCREIGTSIGRSKTTVRNVLRRRNVDARPAAARDNRGERNPHWKGGTYRDTGGYIHQWTPDGHRLQHHVVTGVAPGVVVHHINGNHADNSPENLEVVGTHAEHRARHAAAERARDGIARHPAPRPGESNPRAKLTESDVREIRSLRGKVTQRELGRRFGVSKTAIRLAQIGKHWSCVWQTAEAPNAD